MLYLTTHSAHFIYCHMASDIWLRTIEIISLHELFVLIVEVGGGGGELLTYLYPLKIQACPARDQRPPLSSRVSGQEDVLIATRETLCTCPYIYTFMFRTRPLTGTASGMVFWLAVKDLLYPPSQRQAVNSIVGQQLMSYLNSCQVGQKHSHCNTHSGWKRIPGNGNHY